MHCLLDKNVQNFKTTIINLNSTERNTIDFLNKIKSCIQCTKLSLLQSIEEVIISNLTPQFIGDLDFQTQTCKL